MKTVVLRDLTSNEIYSLQEKLNIFEEKILQFSIIRKINFVNCDELEKQSRNLLTIQSNCSNMANQTNVVALNDKKTQIDKFNSRQKAQNLHLEMEIHDLKVEDLEMKNTIRKCQKDLKNIAEKIGFKFFRLGLLENEECKGLAVLP